MSPAVWLRDRFASFTVATLALTALWAAVIGACVTLYIWDSTFYRSLAPEGMETTFWAAGIVFRTVVIFGLIVIVWAKTVKAPAGWIATIRLVWAMGLIACFVAALGFVTEGMDYRERRVGKVANIEAVTVSGVDDQVAELRAQKAGIETSRDKTLADLQRSIDGIVNDGLNNDHLADAYRIDQSAERDSARAAIASIDARITELVASRQTTQAQAAEDATHETPIPVVFTFMAFGDEDVGRWLRNGFAVFWTSLIELVGGVGAGALYGLHKHAEQRAKKQEDGSKGGRASAKAKMRQLIAYAAEAQRTATPSDADTEDEAESQDEPDAANDQQNDEQVRDEDGYRDRPPAAAE